MTMADDEWNAINTECERIFKRFDVNNDGKISLAEFEEALKALGASSPEEIQSRMEEIDKDRKGYFSLQQLIEFQKANPCLMAQVFKRL